MIFSDASAKHSYRGTLSIKKHTVVARRLKDSDTLLDGSAGVALVVGRVDAWEEGNVDSERLVRELPRLPNRQPKRVGGRLGKSGKDTEAASVRDSSGEDRDSDLNMKTMQEGGGCQLL